MTTTETTRRTPVRTGDRYCSPGCGFGCAHSAFLRATSEAEALCGFMGPGWEPRVWENCGWCWSASRDIVTLHPDRRGSAIHGDWIVRGYSCWLSASVIQPQIITRDATPKVALEKALEEARRNLNSQIEALRPWEGWGK